MSDRLRLSLDLLYVAIENLALNVDDGDDRDPELDGLLALAADVQGSITEYWQALDIIEIEPRR